MTRKNARLIEQLLEDAVEMHSQEMISFHGNDAEHRGLAPEVCSYCKTFEEVANVLGVDLEESVAAVTG